MKPEIKSAACTAIQTVQRYPYDSSINRRGFTHSQRLELTRRVMRGTCTTKHEVLADDLQTIGLDTLYITYPFFWQEIPVEYPEELIPLLQNMPRQNHLALRVLIGGVPQLLDVTWDPGLAHAGFIVPDMSAEMVETPVAVVPATTPVIHRTVEERAEYLQKSWDATVNGDTIGLFYAALNTWLLSLRSDEQS